MLQAADNICEPEKWYLQYWTLAPYTEVTNEVLGGVIYDFIISALKTCCIYATDEDLVFKTHRYENQQRMLLDSKNLSIAFPMICSSISLANAPAEFIRLFQTDGLVQVTRRRGVQGNVFTNGVWTVWPLFVTMIIFTGYAAILLWLSEFCGRFRQFNRGVLKGLFEGYWFAFVSATTVGYGDKVPGTVVGKCFAMFWILCGICVTSAFTAAITTLLSSYQQAITEMAPLDDGKVGVMRGTVDKELLLQKNAYISEYDNLLTMIDGLKNGDVDSIVLDHFFYAHYRVLFRDNVYLRRHSVTQPTTVGIIFNVDSRNGLLECIRKQAFLSHLDIADDVAESVEHSSEDEGKDLFEETAHNLFGNTNLPLVIMASVLIAIVGILIVIDYIINRLSARHGQTNRLYREAATQSNFLLPITESKDIICNNRSNGVGNSISNHQLQSF